MVYEGERKAAPPPWSSVLRCMSVVTTFSVFAALISFVWQATLSLRQLNKITTLLASLLAIEASFQRPAAHTTTDSAGRIVSAVSPPRVAIGYGACTDLLISATEFLNYTESIEQALGPEFTVDEVNDERELLQTFAYYFQNGAAAERVMANSQLFRELVSIAKSRHGDSIRWFIGGNAPLMGMRFQQEGAEVLLASRMSEKLRRLLPPQIRIAGDLIPEDDIHIILEYKAGDTWGPLQAPRANRYILHNDQNNPYLRGIEQFHAMLQEFRPRLLVISGLQMMDSYKFAPGVREDRLRLLQHQISRQPATTLQHFEMASYVELELLQLLRQHILPYVDSLGMNEQELDNLCQVMQHSRTAYASDWNPRIAATLDQMRQVFRMLAQDFYAHEATKEGDGRRLVSRIHVHTLAYQALLVVLGSQWNNTRVAAAKAALTAHRYVCQSQLVNPEASSMVLDDSFATSASGNAQRMEINATNPVPCWQEELRIDGVARPVAIEICVAPVMVCRVAKKTAGAGDNISAAGLSVQL